LPDLYDNPVILTHVRTKLALHQLRDGPGRPLLLIHGLGDCSPSEVPSWAEQWPGGVHALDLTGHGRSSRPRGGGYTAEQLMADVDVALARLGPCTIVGHGLGAYLALLVSGARPELVRGVVLCDGPGLAGGGPAPTSLVIVNPPDAPLMADEPDPYALLEMSRDIRPPDYAGTYARQALANSAAETPIVVCARWRPPWLEAVANEAGVIESTLIDAVALLARQ
jgi:pimeloyl-ACP methyl ester carboxylesterase